MASDPYAHHRATALGDVDDLTWYSTEPLGHYSPRSRLALSIASPMSPTM